MKAKNFLIGLTAGLVGGATAVLLTAPQSGEQLRVNIARISASAKEKLTDVTHEVSTVRQSVTALTNEAKNNIPQIISELKETLTTFKTDIEPETTLLKQEIEILQKSMAEIQKNIPQSRKEEK